MSGGNPADFSDLLRRYAAGQERAAAVSAPDPSVEVLQLASRVRRRRLIRTGTVTAAGVAAALIGAAAVYGVVRPGPVPPAQPTETHSPAPTPSATAATVEPTSEPTTAAPPSNVTRHALLPGVEPATPDLWARTDADWLLGGYVAAREDADGSSMTSPKVLYLVAPDGTAYEVPVPGALLPTDPTMVDWDLRDWRPGDSRAVFTLPMPAGDYGEAISDQVVVDLATGEELVTYRPDDIVILLPGDRTLALRPADAGGTVAQVHDRDGYHLAEIGPFSPPLWMEGWGGSRGWGVDPSRTQLLLDTPEGMRAYALPTFQPVAMPSFPASAGVPCASMGWLEQDRFVVRCAETQDHGDGTLDVGAYLWIGNLGDRSTRRLTEFGSWSDSWIDEVWQVGTDVVVDRATTDGGCGQQIAVVARDGTPSVVGGTERMRVTGIRNGRLVAESYSCDGAQYRGLMSLDVATAQVSMVLPHVEGAVVTFDQGSGAALSSFNGWW